jgi:hypothetical protein
MASGVALIEFGADECVASQTMHRAVKAVANARTGRLEVITLDAWDAGTGHSRQWGSNPAARTACTLFGTSTPRCSSTSASR